MSIADVVIIVIIVLCALLGLLYGSSKSIITLLSWAMAFFGALFLTRFIAGALIKIQFFKDLIFGKLALAVFPGAPASASAMPGGILGAILNPILKPVLDMNLTAASTQAANAAVIAYAIFSAVVMLITFILLRLFTMLFTFLMKKVFRRKGKSVSPVSRLLGFIFNGAKGLLFVFFIFIIGSFAFAVPQLNIINTDIDKGFMGRPMFTVMAKLTPQMISGNKKMSAKIEEILKLANVRKETKEEVTVTFDSNGGGDIAPFTGYTDEVIDIEPVPSAAPAGKVFAGWYDNPAFSGNRIAFPYALNGNAIFYAKWEDGVSVTFETGGGSPTAAVTGLPGTVIDAPEPPTKEFYNFAGWYDNAGFTGAAVDFPYTLTGADTVLYAKWDYDSDTYGYIKVSFEVYGATDAGGSPWQDADGNEAGSSFDKPPSDPVKSGYEFAGWFLNPEFSAAAIFPIRLTENITLYAKFDVEGLSEVGSLLSDSSDGLVFKISGLSGADLAANYSRAVLANGDENILAGALDKLAGLKAFAESGVEDSSAMSALKTELETGGSVYEALDAFFADFDALIADIDVNDTDPALPYDYTVSQAYSDFKTAYNDFTEAVDALLPAEEPAT
jgi:uncharacterized repeat protein (TIGR02543 family)